MIEIGKKYKYLPFVFTFIKLCLLIGLSWLIYEKIWVENQTYGYLDRFVVSMNGSNILLFIFCFMLSPVNWYLESIKWKILIEPIQYMSPMQIAKTIVAGISLGVMTPSRIGEYGGRLLYVENGKQASALFAHFLGSMAQNIVIISCGAICSIFYFSQHYIQNSWLSIGLQTMTIALCMVLLWLFFNYEILQQRLVKWDVFKRYSSKFNIVFYNSDKLHKLLILSLSRYLIFIAQYVILLKFFDVYISIPQSIVCICVIYLFQTGLPLPPALSIVARTQLAVLIISPVSPTTSLLNIIAVPLVLWLVNLLIPSIIGGYLILNKNLVKSTINEN